MKYLCPECKEEYVDTKGELCGYCFDVQIEMEKLLDDV